MEEGFVIVIWAGREMSVISGKGINCIQTMYECQSQENLDRYGIHSIFKLYFQSSIKKPSQSDKKEMINLVYYPFFPSIVLRLFNDVVFTIQFFVGNVVYFEPIKIYIYRMNECSVSECGEHGECVEGVCICTKGWEGPNCTTSKCLYL